MRIKLNNFVDVSEFCNAASSIESDVLVRHGKYVVDGKSLMRLYSLNLSEELTVEVIEKVEGDFDKLKDVIHLMGIVIGEN